MSVVKARSQVINFRASRELAATVGRASAYWGSQVGVRNRDGITPQSVAWAVWMVLDSAIQMSRRTGLPWPKETARGLHAYADAKSDLAVIAWVSDNGTFRLDFPSISLTGVERVPPTGSRLPFTLLRKYELPTDRPVTDPNNRS
jgi:hypothetical protein